MKKKMVLVLILVLVFSNSMVAFGAENSKKRTAKSSDGNTWTYWDGASQDESGTGDSQEVTASYSPTTTTVYNVDISWGNMQYSYSKTGDTTWDPGTHTYGGVLTGSWTVGVSGTDDAVTVGNHSNAEVYAKIECGFEATYGNLLGEFTNISSQCSSDSTFNNTSGGKIRVPKAKFKLASAVNRGTTFVTSDNTGLPQGKAQFAIDGDPGSTLTGTKIGTITVTIDDQDFSL